MEEETPLIPKLKLNGKEYEYAQMVTFDLDEAIVFYNASKVTIDQMDDVEGFHPGVVKGLIMVTIARAEPQMTRKQIEKMVGKLTLPELLEAFQEISEEEEERPPDTATTDGGKSLTVVASSEPENEQPSGSSSEPDSESQEPNPPGFSGEGGSATAASA
jgi:hypothetical protein